jgi:hypothetical protein
MWISDHGQHVERALWKSDKGVNVFDFLDRGIDAIKDGIRGGRMGRGSLSGIRQRCHFCSHKHAVACVWDILKRWVKVQWLLLCF